MDVDEWNQRANLHKFNQFEISTSNDLVIIEIDDESIEQFNTWPWPRSRFAEFLYKLDQASPKLLAFDVSFNSLSNKVNDENFSNAIKNVSFPVILPVSTRAMNKTVSGQSGQPFETTPIKPLMKYSLLGSNDILMQSAGLVFDYPTFSSNGRPTLGALMANKANTPVKPIKINFSIDPQTIPRISYKDIASNEYDVSQIRGKTLLVGLSSTHLGNMYNLPKYGRTPSVFIHALGYETLVSEIQFTMVSSNIILLLSVLMFITLTFLHDDKRLIRVLVDNFLIAAAIYILSFVLHYYFSIMLPVTMLYVAVISSSILQVMQNIKYRTYILFKETNLNNYNKALVNQVIKESANGIIITDLEGRILLANKKAQQLFTISQKNINNKASVFNHVPKSMELLSRVGRHKEHHVSKMEFSIEQITNVSGQEFSVEIMLNKTSFLQHIRHNKLFGKSHHIKTHEIYSFTVNDVTEKMKIIAEKNHSDNALIDLKNNDPLTKLPNRVSFNKILELLYSNTHVDKTSMVMLINLDSIKEINDIYGADVGDETIFQVGRMLSNLVGNRGVVSRFSDKIFAVIYNEIDAENKNKFDELIRQIYYLFSKPLKLHGQDILMAVSMGVVVTIKHGKTPDILMNNATQALDYSKSSKSIKWFIYEEDLARKLRTKRGVRSDIQRALKNEEFVLYYQPQHDIISGKLVGYESLIRWQDPYKGLRFPDEFIPVAEEYGLITEIGELVLKIGCRDAAHWPDDISVAINVSPTQFKNADMAALCLKYLHQSGLPAKRLELEITESMMLDDVEHVIKTLTEIKKLGVRIAMDDFGTGYSSLQYLTELPFDKIKIDRSFTMNIGKSKQTDALISTIVALGHSLDKVVLAEGIESEDMIIMLRAAGCQIGQGYHYGKPMPIKDVREQLVMIEKSTKSA